MTDAKRDLFADSTHPWTMTRAAFWSIVAFAFILALALLRGTGGLDADRWAQATRAALEAQVEISGPRASEPAAPR